MNRTNPDLVRLHQFLDRGEPMGMRTSPLLDALDARLETHDAATSTLTMSFSPPELLRQGAGVIQGGAVSMMLDFVMAFVAMAEVADGASAATVSMSTDYLGAATGDEVTAIGTVDKAGKRVVFARSQLIDGSTLVASAHATLLVVPSPPKERTS